MTEEVRKPTEEELTNLGIGIVPATDEHTPPTNVPIQLVSGDMMTYVHDHVHHWLSEDVYKRTINLPPKDKDRYFQMITDYGDIIEYLLNDDNNIIYEYVKGNPNPWAKLEAHASKSGRVIDYERPAQLIKEYQEWRERKNKEKF